VSQSAHLAEFETQSFEFVRATPRTSLLRVSGVWRGEFAHRNGPPALVVTNGSRAHRIAPLPEGPGPGWASLSDALWRAGYAVPTELVDQGRTRFALDPGDGRTVLLSKPREAGAAARRRAEIGAGGLRHRVAGGTLVNSAFLLAMNALSIAQGLIVAGLLGAKEYGIWGLLTITFGTLFALTAVGIDDKYIQQDHPDQEAAFQVAFTIQMMLAALLTVLALVAVPLFAALYDQPKILVPGLLLALAIPTVALQMPAWIFWRRMDFKRTRLLGSVSPVVGFIVTVGAAAAGLGFWSLVVGALVSGVVSAAVVVYNSPYRLRFRYERGALRDYASFSTPLFVASICGILTFQIPVTIASRTIGAAAVGALALASQITQYTTRVDDVVSHALYPAICAVRDQTHLLFESFSKSNRLAMMWGFPVGAAAALFAAKGVPLILGEHWKVAVPLVQMLGITAAVNQMGFNWTAFASARAETKYLGAGSVLSMIANLSVGVPLLYSYGVRGFAYGIGAGTLAGLCLRTYYLRRLFRGLHIVRHISGAVIPTAAAVTGVLLERALLDLPNTTSRMAIEAVCFTLVVVPLTALTEGPLLRESVGYLRRARVRVATADA